MFSIRNVMYFVMRLLTTILLLQILQTPAGAREFPEIAKCPDFTGTFHYPGPDTALCSHTSRFGFSGLALPSLSEKSGGYQILRKAGTFQIRQAGCSSLVFSALVQWSKPPHLKKGLTYKDPESWYDQPWTRTFHFLPPDKGEERFPPTVEWTENSLKFRSRFIAAGFGAGWGYNAMVFTLEWKDADTLLYTFRHEEGRRGKKFSDIQCELKRVDLAASAESEEESPQ